MLDIKFIKNNKENIKKLLAAGRGNPEKVDIDNLLELDDKRVELIQAIETLNKQRNKAAEMGKQGKIEEARERGIQIKEELKSKEEEFKDVLQKWEQIMSWVPNMPLKPEDMPEGKDEGDNIILKVWVPGKGYIKELEGKKARGISEEYMPDYPFHAKKKDFEPQHHLDIGSKLGIIDNEQSALTSGSRFTYILKKGAMLQYAIQQLLFKELIKRGFIYIIPPLLVREKVLFGSSHFPEGYEQVYKIENFNVEDKNDLYLVGSTEPSNFAYYMDKIVEESELPIRLFAYAPAFRSEAGSWGMDTKGIKRVHQFDKIEMNVLCTPDESDNIFNELLGINEWLLQKLKLPYQLALKCTGDAGYLATAKQVDPEVWIPAQKEFMEVMTDTNTTNFQARRLNIKYNKKDGGKEYVHTVNDTGGAMGRLLISIIAHYQQKDGSIVVPKALRPYLNFEKII